MPQQRDISVGGSFHGVFAEE